MVFFKYSGAVRLNVDQPSALDSIGGLISGTIVPNGFENGLFPNVGLSERKDGSRHIIGLFLSNESAVELTNVYFWFENEEEFVKYKIGATGIATNIQKLNSPKSLPYNVQFFEADGEPNKVNIAASIPAGASIGLWILRDIEADQEADLDCDPEAPAPSKQKIDLGLRLEWD